MERATRNRAANLLDGAHRRLERSQAAGLDQQAIIQAAILLGMERMASAILTQKESTELIEEAEGNAKARQLRS